MSPYLRHIVFEWRAWSAFSMKCQRSDAHPHVQVCTSKMNLSDEVDLEDYVSRPDKISAAEIAAICQEAGMLAVRKNR